MGLPSRPLRAGNKDVPENAATLPVPLRCPASPQARPGLRPAPRDRTPQRHHAPRLAELPNPPPTVQSVGLLGGDPRSRVAWCPADLAVLSGWAREWRSSRPFTHRCPALLPLAPPEGGQEHELKNDLGRHGARCSSRLGGTCFSPATLRTPTRGGGETGHPRPQPPPCEARGKFESPSGACFLLGLVVTRAGEDAEAEARCRRRAGCVAAAATAVRSPRCSPEAAARPRAPGASVRRCRAGGVGLGSEAAAHPSLPLVPRPPPGCAQGLTLFPRISCCSSGQRLLPPPPQRLRLCPRGAVPVPAAATEAPRTGGWDRRSGPEGAGCWGAHAGLPAVSSRVLLTRALIPSWGSTRVTWLPLPGPAS